MPALAEFNRQLKKKMEGMRSHFGEARQDREKLKAEITNLASTDGRREFAMKRLRHIQGLCGGDVLRAKSELAKHCTDITLAPKGNSYIVSGDWNLLGGRSGIPDSTARTAEFSLSLAA
jgi:hypothetical protein